MWGVVPMFVVVCELCLFRLKSFIFVETADLWITESTHQHDEPYFGLLRGTKFCVSTKLPVVGSLKNSMFGGCSNTLKGTRMFRCKARKQPNREAYMDIR